MNNQDRPIDILNPDRKPAIVEQRCTRQPFGCGKTFLYSDLKTQLSRDEYNISGLCQPCQDSAFAPEEGSEP